MNSLDLGTKPKNTRIVVAMSGGVDSSVTAALLKNDGYDVIGITLQLYDHGEAISRKGACCAGDDIYDARKVADDLDIPHYVFNYQDRFKEDVIDQFADEYLKGETPIPCVTCNQTVKFRDLLKATKNLDADALATGHYIRRLQGKNKIELHRGVNSKKDQSYFLFSTTQEQVDFLRFPLGGMSKSETRGIANKLNLKVADKPDSQDICFVPHGNYAEIIKKLRPEGVEPGDIVDLEGNIVGHHEGIIHYTVGQRRGLNIGGGAPLYVIKLEQETRQVVVGPKEALLNNEVLLRNVNWIGDKPLSSRKIEVKVKLRSSQPLTSAIVHGIGDRGAQVQLKEPQASSPGQACVFYSGTRVLGGGWITK